LYSNVVSTRWAYIAYSNFGMDGKGVLKEIGTMILATGSVAMTVYVIVILDPNGLEYRREFSYNALHVFEILRTIWSRFGGSFS
jgi:hypothetical protein